MKRHLFSIVLTILLLACASSTALAETYPPKYNSNTGVYSASSTDKRNVFEFSDLFLYRLDRLKNEYGLDATFNETDFPSYYIFSGFNTFAEKNQYYAVLRAGHAYINVPNFTIDRITFDLIDSYTDDNEVETNVLRVIAAISALEYSAFEDYTFQTYYSQHHKLAKDAVDTSITIYNRYIGPKLQDPSIIDSIEKFPSTNGLLVYSGRYDYYLDYHTSERENDDPYFTYELVAVAK